MHALARRLVSTYSMCVVDPENDLVGATVASRYVAVGALVPFLQPRVGVVLTQSVANPRFGTKGLALLEAGISPAEVIEQLLDGDEQRRIRQLAVLNAEGSGATYAGPQCTAIVADHQEPRLLALGNMLGSEAVPGAMAEAFHAFYDLPVVERTAEHEMTLPNRMAAALVAALRAGEAAGGDRRGKQAAALIVKGPNAGYGGNGDTAVDLRVDDHSEPVEELSRIFGVFLENQREELSGGVGIETLLKKEDL
ncbi:MAG: DUF1028 domain-containing protein [Spirochaetaceae bacterium]